MPRRGRETQPRAAVALPLRRCTPLSNNVARSLYRMSTTEMCKMMFTVPLSSAALRVLLGYVKKPQLRCRTLRGRVAGSPSTFFAASLKTTTHRV